MTAHQYHVLDEMGIRTTVGTDALTGEEGFTVLVDALVGYGLGGRVREPARTLVESMN